MKKDRDMKHILEIYFIAGSQDCHDKPLLEVLKEALQAGITCYQFREKGNNSLEKDPAALLELAQACQLLCRQYGVPFIINDNLLLAEHLQADGVHVGQGDTPIQTVIEELGEDYIIGLSTNNLTQFREAENIKGLDYAGIGPAFTPMSKSDHEAVIGLEGLSEAMMDRDHLAAVAIGGINEANASEVWETGVDGIAIVSAVTQSPSIVDTVKKLKKTGK
ncbi:MAG: thiamine phosphate synthase [Alkalibacterium sp.]|nr:thiamine phosphate synthase [Alkalibacterium sp.]